MKTKMINLMVLLGRKIKKYRFLILFLFVFLFFTFLTSYFYQKKKSLSVPASLSPTPLPTATPTVQLDSLYATDAAVLAIEASLKQIGEEINQIILQEPGLKPPVLDLEIGFDQ